MHVYFLPLAALFPIVKVLNVSAVICEIRSNFLLFLFIDGIIELAVGSHEPHHVHASGEQMLVI